MKLVETEDTTWKLISYHALYCALHVDTLPVGFYYPMQGIWHLLGQMFLSLVAQYIMASCTYRQFRRTV